MQIVLRDWTFGRIELYEVRLRTSLKGHDGNDVDDLSDFSLARGVAEYANLITNLESRHKTSGHSSNQLGL
jgi:hypothetical protein